MKKAMQVAAACGALLFALPAAADEAPVPRMFKGAKAPESGCKRRLVKDTASAGRPA